MEKNRGISKAKKYLQYLSYLLLCSITIVLLVGCQNKETDKNNDNNGNTDGVSTASIVDTESEFVKSVSADGNWITAITKDVTIAKDVVVEGEFITGKKDDNGKDIVQRKIALYAQDADRNITNRYTLTAPKLTIKSPNASLQHGKFVGDIIVEAEGFQLVDNEVVGNIYFASEDSKNSFTMDATSSVSGVQEIK